jgi:hypothetical protein
VTAVTLVGLATDYCVAYSALDAARLGFKATVLEGACRAIDLNGSLGEARNKMRAAGSQSDMTPSRFPLQCRPRHPGGTFGVAVPAEVCIVAPYTTEAGEVAALGRAPD